MSRPIRQIARRGEAFPPGRAPLFPGYLAVLHGRGTEPDVPRSVDILAHGNGTLGFLDRPAHRHRSIFLHVRVQVMGRSRMVWGMPAGLPRSNRWPGHARARVRRDPGRPLHLGGPSPPGRSASPGDVEILAVGDGRWHQVLGGCRTRLHHLRQGTNFPVRDLAVPVRDSGGGPHRGPGAKPFSSAA